MYLFNDLGILGNLGVNYIIVCLKYSMTQKTMYVCDYCGFADSQDDPNMEIEMRQCVICNKDFCETCAEEHAKDETGLVWKNG